ncbi:hypothetical protein ESP57_09520 [Agromyces fucosus]|uniref:Uncharacterized protein n=1 Tax=Agromyces fucosus TaxID=41985 RepID=A0A4Q2JRT7_9MICO|nr:hypothetical protein [Agromyces fucosus]RXZ49167.1 hypothetical protein ESP57_09520 [Agromyces fucosus]
MTTDRIADLERLVYGSGASDDEREAAARELLELRASAIHESASAGADATPAPTGPSDIDATGADGLAVDMPPAAATAADPRRRVRRVIIAATAALVVGVLAGWQLGAREAEQQAELAAAAESVFPGPRTQAEFLASQPAAAGSAAAAVFVRPATDADVPPASMVPDFGNGPMETRLLATRADGSLVFAGRDDSEFCLVLTMGNDLGGAATCTIDGRFPHEGLSVGWSSSGAVPSLDVTWQPDGSLTVSTAR